MQPPKCRSAARCMQWPHACMHTLAAPSHCFCKQCSLSFCCCRSFQGESGARRPMWTSAAGAQQKHSTSQAAHSMVFPFGLKASKQVICFGKTQIRESRFSSAFLTGDTGQSAQTVTRIQWLSTDTRPGAFQCRAGKKKIHYPACTAHVAPEVPGFKQLCSSTEK